VGPVICLSMVRASCRIWAGYVAVGGGVGLAVVGEPVEHGDQGLAGRLDLLAGVDKRPAVPADRVAGGAGLVDDGEIGGVISGFWAASAATVWPDEMA